MKGETFGADQLACCQHRRDLGFHGGVGTWHNLADSIRLDHNLSPLQRALNSGQGLAEEIAESREKTLEVIPRNHVSRVFNASNLDAGL
ncbi:hypothetical protein D9M71_519820 [compost metagenome]